jgi:tRNA(fMet)-specific endonuclease VapC
VNLILDTNALSAMFDGDELAREKIATANHIFVPAVVLGEYRFGVLQSRRRSEYEAWLAEYIGEEQILDITAGTTPYNAEIRLYLKNAGTPIPVNDLWVAALARQHGFAVLSRDHHFDRVLGVQRLSW